jgi:hypothetical protein
VIPRLRRLSAQITVFRNISLCRLEIRYQNFGGVDCLCFSGSLMMEPAMSSEISISIYQRHSEEFSLLFTRLQKWNFLAHFKLPNPRLPATDTLNFIKTSNRKTFNMRRTLEETRLLSTHKEDKWENIYSNQRPTFCNKKNCRRKK